MPDTILDPLHDQEERIVACLRAEFGVRIGHVTQLPLGADRNAAVFRAIAADQTVYFVKLRRGAFDEMAVALPKYLSEQGVAQVIPPMASRSGKLWASMDAYSVIVYPFVEGRRGFDVMSEQHWGELGQALRRIHQIALPPDMARRIRREMWSAKGRELVRAFLASSAGTSYADPVSAQLAEFLQARRADILELIGRAERLEEQLRAHPPEFVLCHSDVHAGNVLIDANDHLYIVDWDEPIMAPKERDLMFAGGAQGFAGHSAAEEERFLIRGYGPIQIDPIALAYYRYERIVQDIAEYSDQIFSSYEEGTDRENWLGRLMNNFRPTNTIEVAYASDGRWAGNRHTS